MKLKLLLILVLVAVGGAAIFVSLGGLPANASGGTTYLTSAAAVGDVTAEIAATGTIETTATYGLAFGRAAALVGDDGASNGPESGATWPVAEVTVEVGDAVTAGDVLATANTTRLEQDLASAVNTLRTSNIQVAIAEEALADADTTDEERQAKMTLYNAQNQHTQAVRDRDDLRADLKHPTLIAPVDGIVTAVAIAAGADAPSGDAITIAATTYEVTADVVESDVAAIRTGQPATITVDALGVEVEAAVVAIAPLASGGDGSVVSYPVTIRLEDVPAGLRPGMSADVTITTASVAGVLTVPSAALSGTDGSYSVRVLDATGAPAARDVEVGLMTDTLVEISSGLAAGELVVTGTAADREDGSTTEVPGRGTFPGGGLGGGGLGGGGIRP
jgi:macrolide-specific efflux system membrane fusion protein